MPEFVWSSIVEQGLEDAYRARPPYQRNDYIGWIMSAKRDETRLKRLTQMLDELRGGDRYMKMAYRPGRRAATQP
ncbi:MAG: YdeI/OmpD-associated family protein [Chloroflexota bacterium]|nr:YdeI/OmpD-associated family protein [Chloroflexota bacterium]MDE2940744.1 YdeI/OmpD-associated family protein [Chloroflexota bacterium]MDE3266926.1 YdeI/OmpD-associated family protein [Chloroflexota bacterium]